MVNRILITCLCCFMISSCDEQDSSEPIADSRLENVTDTAPTEAGQSNDRLDKLGFEITAQQRSGDLDSMEKARVIRVLTVYGAGRYYLDGPQEKGMTYDLFKMFEKFINQQMGKNHLKLHVVFIPVSRDQLIPALLEGRGDVIAAGLTITPERDQWVDFSEPVSRGIAEILVTGPTAPLVSQTDDLAGHALYVRASSSYRSSIDVLNNQFRQQGRPVIRVEDASESLEDEDLLEMVNAGLLKWAVVDDYKANKWAEVFTHIVVRDDIVFRQGGRIGFAVRKGNPKLKAALNEFLKTHRQGTLMGNVLFNRNIRDFNWAKNALAVGDFQRFEKLIGIFETYGKQYGLDYLMVAAQGYQESRLDQNARSSAGAIGIMQLLPSTASDANVGIPDITTAEANIHAGIKYLKFIRERYFSDPEVDQFNRTLFALAAYNAGPARVRRLRSKAAAAGYDPNVWFDNVEVFAAREIGRETVEYVANILKYYIAYSLILQQQARRNEARNSSGIG